MKNKKGNIAIITLIIVIVAITSGVIGWLLAERNKMLTQKTVNQPMPVKVAEKTQPAIQPVVTANETASCEIDNSVYFEVRELGIKFLIDKSIKNDLIYKYSGPKNYSMGSVTLSAKSLVNMDAGCSAGEGPLFAISKIKGTPENNNEEYFAGRKDSIKQFDGFFIFIDTPQAPCSSSDEIESYARQLRSKLYLFNHMDCFMLVK